MCMSGNYSNWGNWSPSNFQHAENAADWNGNGKIRGINEFRNFLGELREHSLGDINGDGHTSAREGRAAQSFVNADRNGDGRITNNEFRLFRQELMRNLGRPVSFGEAKALQSTLNQMNQQNNNYGYNPNNNWHDTWGH